MAFRTFSDSAGREWQAFDVQPRASERRSGERRAVGDLAELEIERREADRRLTVGGRSQRMSTLRNGWLVFESGKERRRLSPVPDNWQRCSDSELDAYLQTARKIVEAKSAAVTPRR